MIPGEGERPMFQLANRSVGEDKSPFFQMFWFRDSPIPAWEERKDEDLPDEEEDGQLRYEQRRTRCNLHLKVDICRSQLRSVLHAKTYSCMPEKQLGGRLALLFAKLFCAQRSTALSWALSPWNFRHSQATEILKHGKWQDTRLATGSTLQAGREWYSLQSQVHS